MGDAIVGAVDVLLYKASADNHLRITYLICGSLSLVSNLLVLLCYVGTSPLSRFPSSMLRWRIVCDAIVSAQFVLLSVHQLADWKVNPDSTGDEACTPTLAFLVQFGMFGSLSWYAMLSLDLYFSVTRPFTRPIERLGLYQAWVWVGSVLTGACAAVRHGYRPVYHVCWTGNPMEDPFTMGSMWMLFFGWLIAYALLSVVVLLYCQSQLLLGGERW